STPLRLTSSKSGRWSIARGSFPDHPPSLLLLAHPPGSPPRVLLADSGECPPDFLQGSRLAGSMDPTGCSSRAGAGQHTRAPASPGRNEHHPAATVVAQS